ncbi:MAG: hypothetical protein Q8P81_00625 [Nanoarchaeota archaeon]|nr:hypothetical protein [Nanoarchaeota archaeon]
MLFYLLLFILASYGITNIVVFGELFRPLREKLGKNSKLCYLIHCPMCSGTYISCMVFLLFWFSGIKLFPNIISGSIIFSFIGSGTSYILTSLFDDFGINVKIRKEKQ